MVARALVCAMLLMTALPAAAGERGRYRPDADTMQLLMLDRMATAGTAVSNPLPEIDFDVRASAMPVLLPLGTDLSSFETLDLSGAQYFKRRALAAPPVSAPSFQLAALPGWQQPLRLDARTLDNGGGYVVSETLGRGRRQYRPGALDATLQLRLDGETDSPPISVGGGVAAALWKVLPGD